MAKSWMDVEGLNINVPETRRNLVKMFIYLYS